MGNCIRVQPAVYWADDDDEWEWGEGTHQRRHPAEEVVMGENPELLEGEGEAAQPSTEVKIRMTKKQLEELLHKVDVQGLPLHLVLAHLVSGANRSALLGYSRQWRPALDSIPEVAE